MCMKNNNNLNFQQQNVQQNVLRNPVTFGHRLVFHPKRDDPGGTSAGATTEHDKGLNNVAP